MLFQHRFVGRLLGVHIVSDQRSSSSEARHELSLSLFSSRGGRGGRAQQSLRLDPMHNQISKRVLTRSMVSAEFSGLRSHLVEQGDFTTEL